MAETVTPPRSGSPNAPIRFTVASGEQATIRGTTLIDPTTWQQAAQSSLWFAPWPDDYVSANNQSDQVFVDEHMIALARWPEEANRNPSFPRQATVDNIVSATDTGRTVPGPQYPITRITFTDAAWDEPDGRWDGAKIWMNSGGHDNGTADDTQDGNGQTGVVISTNLASKQIVVEIAAGATNGADAPGNFQIGAGSYYYLFDPLRVDGLRFNGQFWHDRANDRLYLRTPDGSPPAGHRVEVKQRDYAFNLDDRKYITVSGFRIFGASVTTDAMAGNGRENGGNRSNSIASSSHIVLENLDIRYVSHFVDQTGNMQSQWAQSSGVILSGRDHRITGSTIAWSAGTGLVVIGQGHQVLNNRIHDTNYAATDGGALGLGRSTSTVSLDHEVGYNTIYNAGVDGIEFSALRNSSGTKSDSKARIHHNLVYNTVLQSADSGAIKAFGSDGGWVRIDHNVIHSTGGPDVADKYVFFGIYLDYPASEGQYIIDHNVIYNTAISININGIKNVELLNNTLIARPEVGRVAIANDGPAGSADLPGVVIKNNLASRGFRGLDGTAASVASNITDAQDSYFVAPAAANLSERDYALQDNAVTREWAIDRAPMWPPLTTPCHPTSARMSLGRIAGRRALRC
ncbi:right-handed parallel beta-helix repeat-containing protein [Candidatus Gracilibacteria bacterium]|nr:right-handed parallel beta-helix repeat-containing protein [Candidatus Gracilibacteria bacterium]